MAIIIDAIWTEQTSEDTMTVNCQLEGDFPRVLTYKINSNHIFEEDLHPVGPEFAIMACLSKAMRDGHHIISKIPVDLVFLCNVKLYQWRMLTSSPQSPPPGWEIYTAIVNAWKSELHAVEVEADVAPPIGSTNKTRVGTMGSGGVDTLYTLVGIHEIDDVILIKNMNYPNESHALRVFKELRPEIRRHVIEAPDFFHEQQNSTIWVRFNHGSFLASAALPFSKYFTSMIISGTDRGPGFEIGSGHDVDYLWSSSHMRFFSYGNVTRFRKVEWLGQHEKANSILKLIHLCSDSEKRGHFINCGKCWKCLFTMLIIDSCGLREKATAFDFTNFRENLKSVFLDWYYNTDYTFLHDMPLIMAGYKKQGNDEMFNLCKEYMDEEQTKIPYREG